MCVLVKEFGAFLLAQVVFGVLREGVLTPKHLCSLAEQQLSVMLYISECSCGILSSPVFGTAGRTSKQATDLVSRATRLIFRSS